MKNGKHRVAYSERRAFNVSKAAEYACVSRGTMEAWLTKGLIPYEDLPSTGERNRFRRIRKSDLDAFLDKHRSVGKNTAEPFMKPSLDGVFLLPKSA
jgi:hypothetical protein